MLSAGEFGTTEIAERIANEMKESAANNQYGEILKFSSLIFLSLQYSDWEIHSVVQ